MFPRWRSLKRSLKRLDERTIVTNPEPIPSRTYPFTDEAITFIEQILGDIEVFRTILPQIKSPGGIRAIQAVIQYMLHYLEEVEGK
jgi:hypothetical protein